jgi:hypothetical protein
MTEKLLEVASVIELILFYLFLKQSRYVTQAGLELMILEPQPPKC